MESALRRAGRIRISGKKPRSLCHELGASGDLFVVVRIGVTEHHKIGGEFRDPAACTPQSLDQPVIADDIGG